jgi:hypothetical protein
VLCDLANEILLVPAVKKSGIVVRQEVPPTIGMRYNIAHGILRGKIEVQSQPGEGTRFILPLPLPLAS